MAEEYLQGFNQAQINSRDRTLSSYIRGFDRKDNDIAIQSKRDGQGYVFFTKPFCNLLDDNIINSRRLHWLSDPDPRSMGAAVKCSLMPNPNRHGVISTINGEINYVKSAIVDDNQPFIPMLTTSLTNLSGWPDRITEYFQYDEGIAKETPFHVDVRPDNFGTFDLTATFSSRDGDFINGWSQALWEYQSSVATGRLYPFPAMMSERELDYTFRLYRIVTDESRRFVRKIACTGMSVLGADVSGADFNYTTDSAFTTDNDEISLPLKCLGAMYNDPAIIMMFNQTVVKFNPLMADETRTQYFTKLTETEKLYITEGYPFISNGETNSEGKVINQYELEWWVPTNVYNAIVNSVEEAFIRDDSNVSGNRNTYNDLASNLETA